MSKASIETFVVVYMNKAYIYEEKTWWNWAGIGTANFPVQKWRIEEDGFMMWHTSLPCLLNLFDFQAHYLVVATTRPGKLMLGDVAYDGSS